MSIVDDFCKANKSCLWYCDKNRRKYKKSVCEVAEELGILVAKIKIEK